jgi:hypothetical protein
MPQKHQQKPKKKRCAPTPCRFTTRGRNCNKPIEHKHDGEWADFCLKHERAIDAGKVGSANNTYHD